MAKMTKCKTCGTEIAQSAKNCVACGAKNKQPLFKKWWVWVIVAIILIGIISSTGEKSGTAPTNNNDVTQQEIIEYTVYDVSEMINDLEENALKAEKKYSDQYVEITGKVSNIDSDGTYISLRPSNDPYCFISTMCYIKNDEQLNKVMEMSTDDTVTIKGKVKSVGEVLGYSIDIQEIK